MFCGGMLQWAFGCHGVVGLHCGLGPSHLFLELVRKVTVLFWGENTISLCPASPFSSLLGCSLPFCTEVVLDGQPHWSVEEGQDLSLVAP